MNTTTTPEPAYTHVKTDILFWIMQSTEIRTWLSEQVGREGQHWWRYPTADNKSLTLSFANPAHAAWFQLRWC